MFIDRIKNNKGIKSGEKEEFIDVEYRKIKIGGKFLKYDLLY